MPPPPRAPLVGLGPALALTLACPPPLSELPPACDPNADLCETVTSSPGGGSTSQPTGGASSVTGGDAPQTTSTLSSSTGDPAPAPALPKVVEAVFDPDPLKFPGAIEVTVTVEGDADQVVMTLQGQKKTETLESRGGAKFTGQIEVFSGLETGRHTASFTPHLGGLPGGGLDALYHVELADPGQEIEWDPVLDLPGKIEALAVAGEHVIAFGTVLTADDRRCFLYRRPLDDTPPGATLALFPGTECRAIDLAADGAALWVLAAVELKGLEVWRLARLTWGGPLTFDRLGLPNEVARALARSESGEVAVCGEAPSLAPIQDTLDGRVWRAAGADPVPLDYGPDGTAHSFDEHVSDCAFVGPTHLRLVGHARGRHDVQMDDLTARSRAFLADLEFGFLPTWKVAGPGPNSLTQSFASNLAIDDRGGSFVGVSTCDDACVTKTHALWPYDEKEDLQTAILLDPLLAEPSDLAWSPAGYIILATTTATASGFVLQAYLPKMDGPAWTYLHAKAECGAKAVAVAPKVVLGGGFDGAAWALAFVTP